MRKREQEVNELWGLRELLVLLATDLGIIAGIVAIAIIYRGSQGYPVYGFHSASDIAVMSVLSVLLILYIVFLAVDLRKTKRMEKR